MEVLNDLIKYLDIFLLIGFVILTIIVVWQAKHIYELKEWAGDAPKKAREYKKNNKF